MGDETPGEVERRVLEVVRSLARETGGPRAERTVRPDASLEREVGLGSLERTELLLRLERAFGRTLDDACLALDTPAALARAVGQARQAERPSARPLEPALAPATPVHAHARTLHESLWLRACAEPDRTHVLLREPDQGEQPLTYGRLWQESAAVAGGLLARGVRRGDTVALMLPTGPDFLRAFMGTLAARAVPVPIYPPARLDRLPEYAERQTAILADAGVRLLVTFPRARPVASLLRDTLPALEDLLTVDEIASSGPPLAAAEGDGTDAALVQYTSGSTGRPKGVLLSHDNLLANIHAIVAGLALAPTDVGVSWLPLYHDMGLIGSWLTCLHHGVPLTLLPPTAFLARPERWLWAIHERRATISPAPNFAYELCARRLSEQALEGLDLSCWRIALNGAEPVSPGTLARFAARLRPYGFRPEAMMPVYGLAECSVALTFPEPGRGPRVDRVARPSFERDGRAEPAAEHDATALEFVSVGRELPGHEVRIVDEADVDVGERVVGRLVFRGASATSGYYHNADATAAITLAGGWLDSGDLAYRAAGEIHVCGRRKDLIIKAGRNLVPQEIEDAAAGVEGVRRGCIAAFGVPSAALGTEALVVVAETRLADPDLRSALADGVIARVAEAVGLPPDEVVLVAPGTVPKTSSGKLRRSSTRELFLSGALRPAARTTLGQRLQLAAAASLERLRPVAVRAGRALYGLWLGLALPPVLAFAWLLAAASPSRRLAAAASQHGSRIALALIGCRLEVSGTERLPREGALVLASNHASYVDVPALLAALPFGFVFVAKREVLANPFLRVFVRRCGHLTVARGDAVDGVAVARGAADALRAGGRVLFFPEGTFAAATGLRPFRLGAFSAAAEAGVPIVPVALCGTRRIMRGDWRLPRPGRIRLVACEPISPEGTDLRAVLRLRDRVADAIAVECGEPRLEMVASAAAADARMAREEGRP